MASWQPPIPAGALCSPEAIAINTALPLLGWCYDQVRRDGWLDINLHEVSAAIDVPYHTIKKWWGQLETSGFIAATDKQGRNGMRVRLADAWLDWRSRDAQYSVPIPVPKHTEAQETVPIPVPNSEYSGLNRDLIGTETGPNLVPNGSAYKVLMTPDQAEGETRAETRAPRPSKKAKTKTEHDATLDHAAIVTYRTTFKRTPSTEQRHAIIMAVTDIHLWSEVCTLWKTNRWDYLKVENLISRYEKNGKAHSNGSTNGRLRSHPEHHFERAQWGAYADDEPVRPAAGHDPALPDL